VHKFWRDHPTPNKPSFKTYSAEITCLIHDIQMVYAATPLIHATAPDLAAFHWDLATFACQPCPNGRS